MPNPLYELRRPSVWWSLEMGLRASEFERRLIAPIRRKLACEAGFRRLGEPWATHRALRVASSFCGAEAPGIEGRGVRARLRGRMPEAPKMGLRGPLPVDDRVATL